MNIFQQEDVIKGMPDQALMKEAQAPTGTVPQYLVVSEIQRRADMRKRFSGEQQNTPDTTIKEQIVSGGIADIGQQRQAPQGGMMPPQQQMPAGQPMPPQQPMPAPPQPMPQQMPQQAMSNGGVVRMAKGENVPFTPVGSTLEELAESIYDYERPRKNRNKRYGETREEVISRVLGPDAYQPPSFFAGLGARPKFIESAMESGSLNQYLPAKDSRLEMMSSNEINQPYKSNYAIDLDASRIESPFATKLTDDLTALGLSETNTQEKVDKDLNKNKEDFNFLSSIEKLSKVNTEMPDVRTEYEEIIKRHGDTVKEISGKVDSLDPIDYSGQLQKYNTDFSKYAPDYSSLISEQELRAKKIQEDARKDVGSQALIQLGAGILEGNVGAGLRGAGEAASTIMREARAESSAQQQAADALKVSAQQASMTLGLAGEEAASRQITQNNQIIAKQLEKDREKELINIGYEAEAAKVKADLEGKGLQIFATVSVKEKELLIESIVKEATILRYQDLRAEQKAATVREVMEIMKAPTEKWVQDWMNNNQEYNEDGTAAPPDMDKFEREFNAYINVWMRSFGQDEQDAGDQDDLTASSVEAPVNLSRSNPSRQRFDASGNPIN